MTSTLTRPDTMASGTVAGRTARFIPMYRDGNDSPVVATATVCLPLSFDDLVAALWVMSADCDPGELSTDPADRTGVYASVLDALVSMNAEVTDALGVIDAIEPGSAEYAHLGRVRAVVTAAFGVDGDTR